MVIILNKEKSIFFQIYFHKSEDHLLALGNIFYPVASCLPIPNCPQQYKYPLLNNTLSIHYYLKDRIQLYLIQLPNNDLTL